MQFYITILYILKKKRLHRVEINNSTHEVNFMLNFEICEGKYWW